MGACQLKNVYGQLTHPVTVYLLDMLIPVERLEESGDSLMIVSGEGKITISKHIWREKIVSIVRKDESVYARILVASGSSVKH